MHEQKIKSSFLLKSICMVMLPIFIMLFIATATIVMFTIEYPDVKSNKSFYDTDSFASTYRRQIYQSIQLNHMRNKAQVSSDSDIEEAIVNTSGAGVSTKDGFTIYYNQGTNYKEDRFKYLILNEQKKLAYTNVLQTTKTDTIEKLKNVIGQNSKRWSLSEGTIDTTIPKLSQDEIQYSSSLKYIEETLQGNSIYTAYDEAVLNTNEIEGKEILFNIAAKTHSASYVLLPISILVSLAMIIYLSISCGHRREEKQIYLSYMDKIPLEVIIGIATIILVIESGLIALSCQLYQVDISLCIGFVALCIYILIFTSFYLCGSAIKRIKSKTFFKNSLTYRIFKWFQKKWNGIYESIVYNPNTTFKLAIFFIGFVGISFILFLIAFNSFFGFLLLTAFWFWIFTMLLKVVRKFYTIKDAVQSIYEGKTDIRLDEEELQGVLKQLAGYINDIAGGFSNAIEESLKSERLKTELITNVSHDIKTPLTSIINYIDLLKKENIEDEKVKEYLNILDNKSQRLKKLTEDLLEASKASSGNLKLNKEKLQVKELINQITGEFEDKFKEKGLEVILGLPKEDIIVIADNRYLYRVIENLYSNIVKYALDNSRIYVDVTKISKKVLIAIKNISKQKLNISADELMQRFVRGDSSRNTEGSGLGLSIARSLTELQGGKFDIYLDGDLFKVTLEFEEE